LAAGAFPNTHSVLIATGGQLLYEAHFQGYDGALLHDTRSASKSIASALVGVSVDEGLVPNTEARLYDWLPENLQSTDWTTTVLNASMVHPPNAHAMYGSANPYLLGLMMQQIIPEEESVAFYLDEKLFQPLGITDYIVQNDEKGQPYFGGGMYLNARDLLKFGQLYLNDGQWRERKVLSSDWVRRSLTNYRPLENTRDQNGYGFLWWHHQYNIGGKQVATVEARGTGGQYVVLVPAWDTVVVITSGNYRNGLTKQPERILEQMLLPARLK
ncbi:MAG: serine hydrolase, partial [Bacteroidota bacterium]